MTLATEPIRRATKTNGNGSGNGRHHHQEPPRLIDMSKIIVLGHRASGADVSELADSISHVGLINPITINRNMRLIAGRRRYAAAQQLGWKQIPATIVDLDDLKAELAEIDENLIREDLTVLERAEQLKRRKEIYETLHPQTVQHAAGANKTNKSLGKSHASEIISFASDTAKQTGVSTRTIQHEVQIASNLAPDTKRLIRDTPVADHKTELLKLAKIEPRKQVAIAKLIAKGTAPTVSRAVRAVEREEKRLDLAEKAEQIRPAAGEFRANVIIGDCLRVLPTLKRRTFRLIFADPPYNEGIDYGFGAKADKLPDAQYISWCGRWIEECADLLTPDGSFWLLVSDNYVEHLALAMNHAGLHRRQWLIWYESFGVNCTNKFNRTSRHLLWYVKDPKRFVFNPDAVTRVSDRQMMGDKRANPDGKLWDSVWGINPPIPRLVDNAKERIPDFPTQLPRALLLPIVGCASEPGDQVLDPFCGSGTTGDAAITLRRKFTGIEINPEYGAAARRRLDAITPGGGS